MIKGLEDLKVEYDMTVRNNMGKIAQFVYGDDGFDATRVENQTLPLVGMLVEDVERLFSNIYTRLCYLVVEYSISYICYRKILLYLREESRKRMAILSTSIWIPLRLYNILGVLPHQRVDHNS